MLARILLLSFILLSVSVITNAQSSVPETIQLLCKKWKFKSLDVVPVDADMKEDLDDLIKYASIEFKSDFSFLDSNGEIAEKGKWKLDDTGKELTMTFKEGDTVKLKIITLTLMEFKFKSFQDDFFPSGTLIPSKK